MYSSYCKKKELARQVLVRYLSKCSYLAQMVFKKKGILGAFKYLASTFYLFVKQRFFVCLLLFEIVF